MRFMSKTPICSRVATSNARVRVMSKGHTILTVTISTSERSAHFHVSSLHSNMIATLHQWTPVINKDH